MKIYYWLWLSRAFDGAWKARGIGAGIGAMVVPALGWYFGGDEAWLKNLLWQITVGFLSFGLLAGFIVAPYKIYKERRTKLKKIRKRIRMRFAGEKARLTEQIEAAKRETEAVARERDEWKNNANSKQTPPGKIKDFLHKLGRKGREVKDKSNEKQAWWDTLPGILSRALSTRVYNLIMPEYRANHYVHCADWLSNSSSLANDELNGDFKPEQEQAAMSSAILYGLKHQLQEVIPSWRDKRPMSGTNETLPKMNLAFAQEMKATLTEILTRARNEADLVSLGAYFGTLADLEQVEPEFHALEAFAKRQVDLFDAVLRKLS